MFPLRRNYLIVLPNKLSSFYIMGTWIVSTTSKLRTEAVARRCSVRKGFLRNLAIFTGKYLCQSLFFNKVANISKNTFFTEHLRRLLLKENTNRSGITFSRQYDSLSLVNSKSDYWKY